MSSSTFNVPHGLDRVNGLIYFQQGTGYTRRGLLAAAAAAAAAQPAGLLRKCRLLNIFPCVSFMVALVCTSCIIDCHHELGNQSTVLCQRVALGHRSATFS